MSDKHRRAEDPPELDATALRITVDQRELANAISFSRTRSIVACAIAGACVAALVAAAVGVLEAARITSTVRHDVSRAAVFNCARTNKIAPAVRGLHAFLISDARYALRLAQLDDRQRHVDRLSAAINHDLSVQIRRLGPLVPPAISADYQAGQRVDEQQAAISTALSRLRASSARLWAGAPRAHPAGRELSLADQVELLSQAHCEKLLIP